MDEKKIARFWSYVDIKGPDECWEWTRSRWPFGHGSCGATIFGERRAHRIAWVLTNGPVPDGLDILHSCDNPPCCNPNHLRPGTHAENMRDMSVRGRSNGPRGITHHFAKLGPAIAQDIRSALADGVPALTLAKKYRVAHRSITNIRDGRTWKVKA